MGFFDNLSNVPNAAANAISEPNAEIPDYMIAADAHNVGNNNESFIERAGSFIYHTPEFLGVSVVSGLNSIWNTGVSINNWAGGTAEHTSTSNVLQGIDSDVADFYNQHQDGADAVGFLLTSLLPGVGGIKILNAGQRVLRAAIEDGAIQVLYPC